ncbi:CDP-diacylglycerol diphosphatase [Mycolicibacterium komossense]|uniref:CDP-diacylglycerol diphosphatase n=1 Tax=Mycolicibacterium komossense TaxID=1779 RepID=UPI0021F37D68|nr:CDP-diacylglycerol diphosphatase [Mycolicibacterium komossense]
MSRIAARCTALLAAVLVVSVPTIATAGADPNALWAIVHDKCLPDEQLHDDPAPCALVDLSGGKDAGQQTGYAVLKDLVGNNQFLLIPTARIAGIESPEVLAPGAANYFDAAWRARTFVDQRAGWSLPRDWVSLAINSADARSQNQLHIHIDCVSAPVRSALNEHAGDIGRRWAPFPVPLAGHPYQAIAVEGDNLDAVNPFVALADGVPGARGDMGSRTLVVVGTEAPDGTPGFVILAGQVDRATGDLAEGEELQDHGYCPPPPAT